MDNYSFFAEKPVENYRKGDTWFMILVILMWGLGIFTQYVCSSGYADRVFGDPLYFVIRQLVASAVGCAGLIVFAALPVEKMRSILPVIVIGTLVLCLLTFVPGIGSERNGAKRWIRVPFFSSFQPSEAAKFAVVLFLANLLDKQEKTENDEEKSVMPAVIGLAVFTAIVFLQKDFSTGIFIFAVGVVLFFVSGAKLSWLIPVSIIGIPIILMMIFSEQYRLNRLIAFLRPQEDLQGMNYQAFASKRAISAGGFWGQGLGSGLTRLNSIPEVQADYIFAGWAESMGLVGVLVFILLLCLFAARGYKIAFSCCDRFFALGAFGCVTVIFLQSLLNIAVVCGAVPSTGIPLPFFSTGGSSMIFTLCMCGFIINASRCDCKDEMYFADKSIKEVRDE